MVTTCVIVLACKVKECKVRLQKDGLPTEKCVWMVSCYAAPDIFPQLSTVTVTVKLEE